ncbi:hypothetical protein WG29040_05460 [Pseudomonas sp. PAMC 29040]|uniref:YmfL family putative regulatory protein n=1 Tax=Pseudomonas sp. PAMC 29040 TaxID=2498450 RepID=UPI000FAB8FFB|nr:YmfL family putative regulatory protein [Pseudomonas sp. PAMC 29040]RUT39767.1 hypothetical protein WG29040_05460 [Pseudomonas sp. PAMC 29040]
MRCRILEARKDVIRAIVVSVGGRKNATAHLGMKNEKKFDNHAYQNAGSSPLTDAQIYQLEQVAGTTHYPSYIAEIYGGMFVPVAEPDSLDNVEMYARCVQTAAKRGTVDQIIAQALEDGEIDQAEADAILKADSLHIAARHSEVLAVIQLHGTRLTPAT